MIAGALRGRKISAPPGRVTRPTLDRVRESLFNLLGKIQESASVLDLFAGTGALGIEALSRGAAHATFVEKDRAALVVLRENLAALDLVASSTVIPVDALLAFTPEPRFHIVFVDPPYGMEIARAALAIAARSVAPGGILAFESNAKDPELEAPAHFTIWKSRRYGGTRITLY
ncbi:MAG TPA: 16S rRNA (guanine(966)-N(2))-methyltransferase RsmD, partial [bacterium]|nr:16S rRNA (guanine(966)-N(2))-methyltransferase RsmD [bacterium]